MTIVRKGPWWQFHPGTRPRTHGQCDARCGRQFMSDTDRVVAVEIVNDDQPKFVYQTRLFCSERCADADTLRSQAQTVRP